MSSYNSSKLTLCCCVHFKQKIKYVLIYHTQRNETKEEPTMVLLVLFGIQHTVAIL